MSKESRRTELPLTDQFKLTLIGPLTPEEMAELQRLIADGIPTDSNRGTKAKARPVEFPDEVVEQLIDDIQRDSVNNAEREAAWVDDLLTPGELAIQLMKLKSRVSKAVRDYVDACGPLNVKVKKPEA